MKKLQLVFFGILGLIGFNGQAQHIQGRVFDKDTKVPIERAKISMYDDKGVLIDSIYTVFDGSYSYAPANPGAVYKVTSSADDFSSAEVLVEQSRQGALVIFGLIRSGGPKKSHSMANNTRDTDHNGKSGRKTKESTQVGARGDSKDYKSGKYSQSGNYSRSSDHLKADNHSKSTNNKHGATKTEAGSEKANHRSMTGHSLGLSKDQTKQHQMDSPDVFGAIYYDFNSSYFNEQNTQELDRIVQYLRQNPQYKVQVDVYLDTKVANVAYQEWLVERRKDRILHYMIEHGIPSSSIQGIIKPVAGWPKPLYGQTPNIRDSRRCDFIILK